MITTWLITIISLLIGYALGVLTVSPDKREELAQKTRQLTRKVKRQKIGAVEPLSPAEMEKVGTRIEETERAMEEDLDKIL